jgi:tetratricopeptide (TPR) repeat protein
MIPLLAALLVAAADPCAPVGPAGSGDPASAALYRKVGDAERTAGAAETATVAYRTALGLDPSDVASRRALAELCRAAAKPAGAFQRGLALMDRGDLRGAITAFQEARAVAPDPSAALLEGVCRYENGDDREARTLFLEAEQTPAHRSTAELYLGLLALREGEVGEAARLLDAAGMDPALAPMASAAARRAQLSGKLVLSILTEAGWDSNAQLAPTATPVAASNDTMFGVTVNGLYRPMGENGPYLRASGLYRQQLRFGDLDYGGASAAAGWQLGSAARGVLAEYDYDYRLLGGASFLSAHRLLASGWIPAGRGVTLGATYFARFESYPAALYAPFSGVFQRAEVTASMPLGRTASLLLAYHLGRDAVELSSLSFVEHGPAAELRYSLGPRLRVSAGGALTIRDYDALDSFLGVKRSDSYLDGVALLEWAIAGRWTVRLSLDVRDAISNANGFSYLSVMPVLGLAYLVGM